MRAAFSFAILCIALAYTYVAFTDLSFLSSTGRLGPAFFPRIIGVALIAACLYGLAVERSQAGMADFLSGHWRVTLAVAALSGLFVLLLNVLGGVLAMIVFLLATLTLLNRGRIVQNLLVSLLLPIGVYLMFDVWLNASMPEGLVRLPG